VELTQELTHILAKTPYCRSAIAELADELAYLTPDSASLLVSQLTEQGEDVALNRLLNVCAYREMRLSPSVLAESISTIDDSTHFPYCVKYQDSSAIVPLLNAARSEALSWERQVLASRLATELAVRYNTAHDEAKRTLFYLREEVTSPVIAILVQDTLRILDANSLEEDAFPIMIDRDIHTDLPERPPAAVIGGGGTVRRPIAKLGRNDPCHCGSGKKYKRCCCEKDREVLADASQYAGITQTQLHQNPGLVDDACVIQDLRSYEIKKLNPEDLSTEQLWAAYRRAQHFGLLDIALDMLIAISKRTDGAYPFDAGHFVDLMHQGLSRGDLAIAKRARDLAPADLDSVDWDFIDVQFELHTTPGLVETVEGYCKEALTSSEPCSRHDFCDLSHTFRHQFPALSILFARAALQQHPERILDNELLVENVHQARIDLGLDPWEDPIDDLFYDDDEADESREVDSVREAEEKSLREELARTREQAKATARRLAQKEEVLDTLTRQLECAAEGQTKDEAPAHEPSLESLSETKEKITSLRRQVDNLKGEIGNQQEARKRLRHQLEQERQRTRKEAAVAKPEDPESSAPALQLPSEKERTVLIPEYSRDFRDTCPGLPASVIAKALKAVAGFAAYDAAVWKHTRAIKQLPGIYRIRIGIHYRLLLHWLPSETLQTLDLIPRQDLETWIRRHLA
jgi:hypothetical protein